VSLGLFRQVGNVALRVTRDAALDLRHHFIEGACGHMGSVLPGGA